MANDVTKIYKFGFEFNKKEIKMQLNDVANDVKAVIADIAKASDKVVIFKDMADYIERMDSALNAFRQKNKGALQDVFKGMDKDGLKYMEKLFGADGAKLILFDDIKTQLKALQSDTTNVKKTQLEGIATHMKTLMKDIGVSEVDLDALFQSRMSSPKRIEAMLKETEKIEARFKEIYKNGFQMKIDGSSTGGGNGAADGLEKVNNEIKEQINTLEKNVAELQKTKTKYQNVIKLFNGSTDIEIGLPEKAADQLEYLKQLKDEFYNAKKAKQSFEDKKMTNSNEYLQAVAKYIEIAAKVNAAFNHQDLKGKGMSYTIANSELSNDANAVLNTWFKNNQQVSDRVTALYRSMMDEVAQSIALATGEIATLQEKLNNPTAGGGSGSGGGSGGGRKLLKTYQDLLVIVEKISALSTDADITVDDSRVVALTKSLKELYATEQQFAQIDNVFRSLFDAEIGAPEALIHLRDLFGIEIPEGIKLAEEKYQSFIDRAIDQKKLGFNDEFSAGKYFSEMEVMKHGLEELYNQGRLTEEQFKKIQEVFNSKVKKTVDDFRTSIKKDSGDSSGKGDGAGSGTDIGKGGPVEVDFSDLKTEVQNQSQKIVNKLGETLRVEVVKDSSNKNNGVGNSDVDVMKANLQRLFQTVNDKNNQKNYAGAYQDQEVGAAIMSDGTVAIRYGEQRGVPNRRFAEAYLSNLNAELISQIHSHPFNFLDRKNHTGVYTSDTFSGFGSDLSSMLDDKNFGIQLKGLIAGNILKTIDMSKLTKDQLNNFVKALADVEQQYTNDPKYSKYISYDEKTGKRAYRTQDSLEEQHKVTQIFESMLYDAFAKIGLSKDKVDSDIYRSYDMTNDKDLTEISNILVNLSRSANNALTPVQRLSNIIKGFGGNVNTDRAKTLFEAFEKGTMGPAEVFNELLRGKMTVSQDMIDSMIRIDSASEGSTVESMLTKISGTLSSIDSSVQNISNNTKLNTNEKLSSYANDIVGLKNEDYGVGILSRTDTIFDPTNNSKWQGDQVYQFAQDAYRTFNLTLDDMLERTSKGMALTINDVDDLIQSYSKAMSYITDAQKQFKLYTDTYGEAQATEKGTTYSHLMSNRYNKLASGDTLDKLLSVVNYAQKGIFGDSGQNGVSSAANVNINSEALEGALTGLSGKVEDNTTKIGALTGAIGELTSAITAPKQTTGQPVSAVEEIQYVDKKDLADVDKKINDAKRVISNAQDWLRHLGWVFDDESFKSTGKKDATDKLKLRTERALKWLNASHDELMSNQMARELANIAWTKAYKEAQRVGVADSTLDRLNIHVDSNYDSDLASVQEQYDWWIKTLERAQTELTELQAQKTKFEQGSATSQSAAASAKSAVQSDYNVDVAKETADLKLLQDRLGEVKKAIIAKTKAFYDEGTTVGQVVGKEISTLNHLLTLLGQIEEVVLRLTGAEIKVGTDNLDAAIENAKTVPDKSETSNAENTVHTTEITTLNDTIVKTNGILNTIYNTLTSGGVMSLLVEPFNTAVTELKNVANGIIDEHNRKKIDTREADARLADTATADEIRQKALDAVRGRVMNGGQAEVTEMVAMADGLVKVVGYIQTATDKWEGFTLQVNQANEASKIAFSTNTKAANAARKKAEAEIKAQQQIANQKDPYDRAETESKAYDIVNGYQAEGKNATVQFKDNGRYTVSILEEIGGLQKQIFQTFDENDDMIERTTVTMSTKQLARIEELKKLAQAGFTDGHVTGDDTLYKQYKMASDELERLNSLYTVRDDLTETEIAQWNSQIDLVQQLGNKVESLINQRKVAVDGITTSAKRLQEYQTNANKVLAGTGVGLTGQKTAEQQQIVDAYDKIIAKIADLKKNNAVLTDAQSAELNQLYEDLQKLADGYNQNALAAQEAKRKMEAQANLPSDIEKQIQSMDAYKKGLKNSALLTDDLNNKFVELRTNIMNATSPELLSGFIAEFEELKKHIDAQQNSKVTNNRRFILSNNLGGYSNALQRRFGKLGIDAYSNSLSDDERNIVSRYQDIVNRIKLARQNIGTTSQEEFVILTSEARKIIAELDAAIAQANKIKTEQANKDREARKAQTVVDNVAKYNSKANISDIQKEIRGTFKQLGFDEYGTDLDERQSAIAEDYKALMRILDEYKIKIQSGAQVELKGLNEIIKALNKKMSLYKQDQQTKYDADIVKNANDRYLQKTLGQVNYEKGTLGFNFNSRQLTEEQQEIVKLYDKLTLAVDEYEIKVKHGQDANFNAINTATEALLKQIDAYKQANKIASAGTTGNRKAPKSSVVTNVRSKYNTLSGMVADNAELANSTKVMSALDQYTLSFQKLENLQANYKVGQVLTNKEEQEFNDARIACNKYAKELENLIRLNEKSRSSGDQAKRYRLEGDFQDTDVGRQRAFKEFLEAQYGSSATFEKFTDNYNKMIFTVRNSDGTFARVTAAINNTRTAIDAVTGEAKEAAGTLGKFWNELKGKFGSILSYTMASVSIHDFVRIIKQGATYVRDIDSALTELKKVTNETDVAYSQFLQDMAKTGSVVGSTVKDLTTMAAEWARLGYSMEEAGKLAESTAILLNVSEFNDATAASEALISTMQAFQYTADESQHVVDILNEVGNNYAVSSDGIATALQDSASALMEGGNNLEQATALVAAANRVVQDPSSVGSALRTISLRLRGTSVAVLEEMGEETDGVVESVSKMQEKIKALTGVDIVDMNGAYKDTYTILHEIGQVWDNLTDMDKAAALELMAGKNRANTLSAILSNMKDLEGAYKSALGAEGSALKENEAYLDSIQGRIDLFNNSLQTMWMNTLDSDMIKTLVDIASAAIKVVDSFGLIPSAIGGFAGIKTVISSISQDLKKVDEGAIKTLDIFKKKSKENVLIKTQEAAANIAVAQSEKAKAAATSNDTSKTQANTLATYANVAATKALTVAKNMAKGILVGLALSAVTSAVSKLTSALMDIIPTKEKILHQAEELKDVYKQESDTIKDNIATIQSLEDEFKKLSVGVDDYGNNVSLATDDYVRYQEIIETLVGMSPSLIAGYDAEGNALANKNGLLQKSIELMQEEQRLKAKEYLSNENIKTVIDGEVSNIKEQLETILPSGDIKYAVKIETDGSLGYGYNNNIADYIEQAIGVDFQYQGIDKYIQENLDLVEQNLGTILNNASNDFIDSQGNMWKGLDGEQLASLENYIKSIIDATNEASSGVRSMLQLIPQSKVGYYDLNESTRQFLNQYANSFSVTKDTTQDDIDAMMDQMEAFSNFVVKNSDVEHIIEVGYKLNTGKDAEGNVLNVKEYRAQVEEFKNQIQNSSYTDDEKNMLLSMLDLDDNDINAAFTHVTNILKGQADALSQEAQNYIDSLSISEVLYIKANISADASGLSIDELNKQIANTMDFDLTDYTDALSSHSAVISEYQEAIQKLGKGSFTMDDFMELVEKYPDLTKGVDISSNAFYGLSRNLNRAIKSNTKSFINDLKELKYRLLEAGKSTTAIDQLIEAAEKMSTNALDSYIDKYSTLAYKINAARTAQDKLLASMEENPNEGYETRGDTLEYMKNKMRLGEIGSESELWSVAEEYGFTYDSALSINENADALAKFIAVRDEWFAKDDDGNYTFDGTETFIKAVDKAVDENARLQEILAWDYNEDKGIFNADFDNENFEEIVNLLGQTEGLVNLTSEEFSDMMIQIGQYFGVKWGDNQDILDHLDKIATGASDANAKVEEYGKTMQQYFGSDTTIDLSDRPVVNGKEMSDAGWDKFKDGDYATVYSSSYSTEDGSKTIVVTPILPDGTVLSEQDLENYANKLLAGEEIDPDIDIKLAEFNGKDSIQQAQEYSDALHKAQEQYDALRDPLDINTTIDQSGIEGLEKIDGLQDTITQNSDGVTIVDQDAFETVLQEAGYTEEYIDRLIKKIQKLNEESENTFSVESKNKDPLGLNSANLSIDSLKQSLTDLGIEFSEVWGSLLNPNTWFNGTEFTINVTDLVTTLKAQGWDNESIKAYCQQLITDTEIEGYNIHISGIENIDEVIAKADEVPETETIDIEIAGTAYQDVKNINNELSKLPTNKTVTVNEVTKKTTKKWNPNTKEWEYVAGANGTAHAMGTAFKSGSWGAPKTETSLVGELGPELLVRGNRWTTVGENGAEFTDIRRGDIVFNHKQTESLLKNGYITSRGKAYASGTNDFGIFGKRSQDTQTADGILDKLAESVENLADATFNYSEVVQKDASHNKDTWVSKGSFEDGYQFGDYTKLAVGSTWDTFNNFLGGAFDVGEKTIDTVASIIGETIKNEEVAAKFADFIKKDLYSGKDLYEDSWLANAIKHVTGIDPEVDSMYGDKFDGWIQSAGNTGMTALLQYLGVPWWVTSSVSTVGSSMEGALNEGATFDEAAISSSASAVFNILLEKVGGINFGGGKTLSDIASDGLTKNISNTFAKKLTQFGLEHLVFGEGTEEVLEEIGGNFAKWLTYQDDKTFKEMFASPEALDSYIESYIGGTLMGEGFGLFKSLAGDNKNVDSKVDNQIDSAKFVDESKQEQSSTQRDFGKPISEELERHIVPGQIAQYSQMLADNTDYVIKQAFRTMPHNVGTLMSNNYLDHDGMRAAWYSNSANESKEYGPYEPGELDNPLHEPRRAVMSDLIMKNPYVVDAKGKTWKELIDPMLFSEDQFNDLKNIQEAQQALTSFIDSIDGHDIDTSYLASTNPYIKEMQKIYSSPWMFKQQKQNKYDQMAEDLKNKYEGYLLSRNMGAFDISSQLMVRAYQAGYGGLIAKDVVDSSGRAADQYVVFDESQIQNIRELIQGFGEVGTNEFDMHILSENARMAYNNLMRESDESYVNQKLNDQIQDLRNVISENEAYLANQYKRVENKDFDMFFNEHTYDSYINSTKENQIKLQQKLESLIRESSEGAVLLDNLDLSLVSRLEDLMSTVSSSDWQIENKEFGGLREDQYYNYKLIKNRLDTEASQKAINDYTKVIESNPPNLEVIDAHAKLIQAEQAKLAEFEQQKLAIEQKIAQLTDQLNQTPEVPEVVPQEPETKTTEYNVIGNGVEMAANAVDNWTNVPTNKTTNYTVNTKYNTTGTPPVDIAQGANAAVQAANAITQITGKGFANGSDGVSKTETALVGELGPEMLVRNGRWMTVGDNGAEFTQVKKGDIIFNHKQTEELLSKGHIADRGKLNGGAFASGTAFSTIEGTFSRYDFSGAGGYQKYDVNGNLLDAYGDLSNAADSLSDAADEFNEVFDWIEVRLEELEERLSLFQASVENATTVVDKNNIIDKMINVNNVKLDNLAAGYNEYSKYADSLLTEVPEKYRDAAQNGAIAIEKFVGEADETTLEAIQNYREWVQKAADLKQQMEEVVTAIRDLAIERIDNAQSYGDIRTTVEDSQNEKLQNAIDLIEAMGKIPGTAYYGTNAGQALGSTGMFENSYKKIEYLGEALETMQAELNKAVENGELVRGTVEWYEQIDKLYQVQSEIAGATKELEEFQNAINDLHWENFDQLINRLDYIESETQSLVDLMANDDLVGDPVKSKYENGTVEYWTAEDVKYTKEGIASLGLYAQQMELAEFRSKQYAEAIDDLTADYNKGLYSENEYLEKLNELKESQYESIEAYYDAQDAIKELNEARIDSIKEGIEKEIEAYEELIEAKKEALSSEKDLYDFQKQTMEQEKNIADIERKLAALAYDTSLSAAAQRKRLEAELAEANAELQESYYNRSIEDQQNALDQELEDFNEAKDAEIAKWEEYAEDIKQVITDSLALVQANATGIYDTLSGKAEEYNLTLSNSITTPWQDGALAVDEYQETFGNAMSSTMDQLETMKQKWQGVIAEMERASKAELDVINKQNADYAEATKKEPVKPAAPSTSTNQNTTQQPQEAPKPSLTKGSYVEVKPGTRWYANSAGGGPSGNAKSGTIKYVNNNGAYAYNIDGLGWIKKSDIVGYKSGTTGVKNDQFAWIDEMGLEELVMHAGPDGRLQYLSKGSAVIPHDITKNLMEIGQLDPSMMIDQNRPAIGAYHVVNNEISITMDIAEVVHIDKVTNDTIPDLTKAVQKQMDSYMSKLNNAIKSKVR